jgi:hypothetical protein
MNINKEWGFVVKETHKLKCTNIFAKEILFLMQCYLSKICLCKNENEGRCFQKIYVSLAKKYRRILNKSVDCVWTK